MSQTLSHSVSTTGQSLPVDPSSRDWLSYALIASGAFWALLGVGLGAFGAHGLKDALAANESAQTWRTAVSYQMTHALALLIVGALALVPKARRGPWLTLGCLWEFGILAFSGSLYWLALDGPRWLGPITPLGGVAFILGWGLLLVWALRRCLTDKSFN
ncbi:MAG: DUF423 domain-containing protein [Opitutales bacterium]